MWVGRWHRSLLSIAPILPYLPSMPSTSTLLQDYAPTSCYRKGLVMLAVGAPVL